MGSTDKAVITGFICRLCSKMNRFVIHIYGEEGSRMKLAEKINTYLPITVNAYDQLPKTACLHCIERLEAHHELMEQFSFARRKLTKKNINMKNEIFLIIINPCIKKFLLHDTVNSSSIYFFKMEYRSHYCNF
ncbi:unnamed protein product [Trichogramma brassicae]|uniref:ZAD domain-containing protein n=1 Tax=Trichogramma brassicae TaxID=86971 RepID=A0A6H5I0Y4_9HYME|nr:unnamed protein product [Trichogramma brassicae]